MPERSYKFEYKNVNNPNTPWTSGSTDSVPFKIKPLRAIIIIELDKLFVFIIISGTQNKLNIRGTRWYWILKTPDETSIHLTSRIHLHKSKMKFVGRVFFEKYPSQQEDDVQVKSDVLNCYENWVGTEQIKR